jgi:hypothetical protein
MDIVSALFCENIALRQVPGPSTRIDLTGMLTHTFGLRDWQHAFATIADQGRTGAIKVAIDPQR